MKLFMPFLLALCCCSAFAQRFEVKSRQGDAFSVALAGLLNAAPGKFKQQQGDFLQYTRMQESEYRLLLDFPASTAAIIRDRDWSRDAYVEFRGFRNRAEFLKGLRALQQKILDALGGQVYQPEESAAALEKYGFSSYALKDSSGHFDHNIELFGSRSRGSYLLPLSDSLRKTMPEEYFVLLKVSGGEPGYNYFVRNTSPADTGLHRVLCLLLKQAKSDFEGLKRSPQLIPGNRRDMDTLQLNGYAALIDYQGPNRTARLHIPVAENAAALEKQWMSLQQAIESAGGKRYVYRIVPENGRTSYIVYWKEGGPTIYLRVEDITGSTKDYFAIIIMSEITHRVSRKMRY